MKKNTSINVFAGLSLALFIILGSCDKYSYELPGLEPGTEISFSEDIIPIFTGNCTACHGGAVKPDLTPENAWESLQDGYISDDPENNPEDSKIYSILLESGHSPRASELEKQQILEWIRQGALNN